MSLRPPNRHTAGTRRRDAGWRLFLLTVSAGWVAAFLAQMYERADAMDGGPTQWVRAFALFPKRAFGGFEAWRLLTYAAVHQSPLHLACDLMALAAFGTALAGRLGAVRAMIYAFAGCVAGGLAAGVGALTLPEKPVVGGAGLICGVTAVYVMLRGADPLIYVGQVVVPTAALAGLLAFASLASSASGGQWFSLLQAVGGPAAAACYLLEPRFLRWLSNRRQRVQAREAERDLLVVRRVDDLLVKVQAQGLDGLTRAELAFLRRASRRYRDRILPVASSPPVQQQENTR